MARLLLPLPLRPVMATSCCRGICSEMFFKLCVRAPVIRMNPGVKGGADLDV